MADAGKLAFLWGTDPVSCGNTDALTGALLCFYPSGTTNAI